MDQTVSSSAPTSAPAAPVASPSVGTGPPVPSPTTPRSFSQEFAAQTAKPVTPETPVAPTTPGTPAPPATVTPPAPVIPPKPPGPIPFEAHQTALANARRKAAEETEARYAWAKTLPPEEAQGAIKLAQAFAADPVRFVREMAQRLSRDPQYRDQMRPAARAATPPAPDLMAPDGTRFYSEKAQAEREKWLEAKWNSRLDSRLAPIEQDRQTRQQQEQRQQIATRANEILAEHEKLPLFAEHAAEILAEMEKDGRLGLQGAYHRVVVPKLAAAQQAQIQTDKAATRAEILKELEAKAAAGSVNPGTATAPSVGKARPRSTLAGFQEGFRKVLGGA